MLTKREIENAAPGARLNNGRGLLLIVSPAGTKSWRLRFKRGGKDAVVTLGQWPEMSIAEAEAEAAGLRKGRKAGIDPAVALARQEATGSGAQDSFEDVARRYVKREAPRWSEGHRKRFDNRMVRDVFPVIGKLPIASLVPADVARAVRPIEQRGAQDTALRVVGMVGQVCRFAVAKGLRNDDPTIHLAGGLDHPAPPKHRPAIVDPEGFGQLMADLADWHGDSIAKPYLLLTAYVWQRPGEVRAMRWSDVDLGAGLWAFRVTKVGLDHLVPLAPQAVAILRELERGRGRSEYVFRSSAKAGYISDAIAQKLLEKLGYAGKHCTHGFRASARTLLVERLRYPSELVERQLSHTVRAVHGRAYDRTEHLEQRAEMMCRWASYVDQLRDEALGVPALAAE